MFTIVLKALSRHFMPWELFYADDLVLLAESRKILMEKIKIWKEGLEGKRLKVNIGKTKVMKCDVHASRVWQVRVGICGKSVGRNSIQCGGCQK